MSYQVLARKWRPQRFDQVVGQRGVIDTLRNAIAGGRVGQAFIFAGARGVGKTTTARILAKALNCVNGPTVDPCGVCDACVEIAEGRDVDVLEIDAATNTQVEKVREVIINGLGLRPVRDRFRIFIIDEAHQLSSYSFNALLKSIEEPPPHVKFIMATTDLHKIPDTIRSRAQEFEFRTIGTRAIADELQRIATAEGVDAEPAAIQALARAAEGSLRDGESALDQLIAFSSGRITADDVATVLGLVGRDFLLDVVETIADEDAPKVFDLASRATESGHDLRLLCRELSRLIRDLMVVAIDPSRLDDPEYTPEGDPARLRALAARFSREDLLRAFDLLAEAEEDLRIAAQPRYHLEMALLKWIHLRKLVPIDELIQTVEQGRGGGEPPRGSRPAAPVRPLPLGTANPRPVTSEPAPRRADGREGPSAKAAVPPAVAAASPPAGEAPPVSAPAASEAPARVQPVSPAAFKEAFLEQIKRGAKLLHGMAVAQAARIDVGPDVVTFVFAPQHRVFRDQIEQKRSWLENIASELAGQRMRIALADVAAPPATSAAGPDPKDTLREKALGDNAVQAMLDVFTTEITDVREVDGE